MFSREQTTPASMAPRRRSSNAARRAGSAVGVSVPAFRIAKPRLVSSSTNRS